MLCKERKDKDKETRTKFYEWALLQLDNVWRPRLEAIIKRQEYLNNDPHTGEARKRKRAELCRRPLSDIPFTPVEHGESDDERERVCKERKALQRDECLLDGIRKQIEKGWPKPVKGLVDGFPVEDQVGGLPIEDPIQQVRLLDHRLMGMQLLPSAKHILSILSIVDKACLLEEGLVDNGDRDISTESLESSENCLKIRDI
ncbi:hypothetical protein E4T47_07925 [Aureobasidium subglaciale]|nr:hypothetical protein E4T43_07655 [Aureobasidium subglaciale]KAI5267796.1 hypothetical protein E4T47_07925 [Aureobasidium subglaciale]